MSNSKSNYKPLKIISGGQTGADLGGLVGARRAGIETGGTAAMDWMTELGPRPELANYGLVECTSWGYPARTEENILNACATVIFTAKKSRGSDLTVALCLKNDREYIVLDPFKMGAVSDLQEFCRGYEVVNVAGNRERVFPGICAQVAGVVYRAFGDLKND